MRRGYLTGAAAGLAASLAAGAVLSVGAGMLGLERPRLRAPAHETDLAAEVLARRAGEESPADAAPGPAEGTAAPDRAPAPDRPDLTLPPPAQRAEAPGAAPEDAAEDSAEDPAEAAAEAVAESDAAPDAPPPALAQDVAELAAPEGTPEAAGLDAPGPAADPVAGAPAPAELGRAERESGPARPAAAARPRIAEAVAIGADPEPGSAPEGRPDLALDSAAERPADSPEAPFAVGGPDRAPRALARLEFRSVAPGMAVEAPELGAQALDRSETAPQIRAGQSTSPETAPLARSLGAVARPEGSPRAEDPPRRPGLAGLQGAVPEPGAGEAEPAAPNPLDPVMRSEIARLDRPAAEPDRGAPRLDRDSRPGPRGDADAATEPGAGPARRPGSERPVRTGDPGGLTAPGAASGDAAPGRPSGLPRPESGLTAPQGPAGVPGTPPDTPSDAPDAPPARGAAEGDRPGADAPPAEPRDLAALLPDQPPAPAVPEAASPLAGPDDGAAARLPAAPAAADPDAPEPAPEAEAAGPTEPDEAADREAGPLPDPAGTGLAAAGDDAPPAQTRSLAPVAPDDPSAGAAPAEPSAPADPGAAAERPQIGAPAGTLTDTNRGVPIRKPRNAGPLPETPEDTAAARPAAPGADSPLRRFAAPAEALSADQPRLAIVLIDDGVGPLGPEAVPGLPVPVTFAIDPRLPDAASRMAGYRAHGFEVMALAAAPKGARADDIDAVLDGAVAAVPEAVALLEAPDLALQEAPSGGGRALDWLGRSGHGVVALAGGLDTLADAAGKAGVPAATVFRELGRDGEAPRVQRRILDQAAFRARQTGSAVVVGRLRADTLSALVLWGLANRDDAVAVTPISALLDRQAE
ncbi:divergent polysaccharide deacetylase family protein [Roseivivax sp. CAU 1761]